MLFFPVSKCRENVKGRLGRSFPLGPQARRYLRGFLIILVDEGLISVIIRDEQSQTDEGSIPIFQC